MKKNFLFLITVLSLVIPGLVALLFFSTNKVRLDTSWVYVLPHINAWLNGTTALLLVLGWVLIKNQQPIYHRYVMLSAFFLGTLFLISYIIYHATVPSVVYGDTTGNGIITLEELSKIKYTRPIYLIVLISHILLAMVTVPLVLITFTYAFLRKMNHHKKIARYTFPIWLYVSLSGVVVYWMIKPYYLL